jgi:hypothetical protein
MRTPHCTGRPLFETGALFRGYRPQAASPQGWARIADTFFGPWNRGDQAWPGGVSARWSVDDAAKPWCENGTPRAARNGSVHDVCAE